MIHKVYKAIDRPASFMWFKGRFVLFPISGIVLSLVLILVMQTFVPILIACLGCILTILIPSALLGLRLQDKIDERALSKLFLPQKQNLRISIPASCIKRHFHSDLINHYLPEKVVSKNNKQ